ncbi:hypothetical protein RchiOBHm_Chr3g0470791 [Rosa chinensis]|uniref:Uncharacterized protein n=1 Tax=Rosa chinensis TaxID=74649 RepID=A0A2P6RB36_ROSCH|nr:hypothetical protein RchiOBHm_Chr3g0470791 [Rosa chinensis]
MPHTPRPQKITSLSNRAAHPTPLSLSSIVAALHYPLLFSLTSISPTEPHTPYPNPPHLNPKISRTHHLHLSLSSIFKSLTIFSQDWKEELRVFTSHHQGFITTRDFDFGKE